MRKYLTPGTIFLALAALVGTAVLLLRIRFELAGAYHTDTSIYLTVSRGILNGLLPYADLYENKPPGMFMLGALSLWLFNGAQLLIGLQALILMLFPFCIVLPVLYSRAFPLHVRTRALVAWTIGCALALYSAFMAGTLLPESFGAFFGAAFVALLAARQKSTWTITIFLSLFLAGAVGIKEPFLLSTFAGALIVLPSLKSSQRLVLPFVITAAAGLQIMILLGYLWPYISIDLAHIFGFHVFNPWGTVGEPLWLRVIDLPRIFWNLWSVSPVLPFIIAPLWIGTLVLLLKRESMRTARLSVLGRWLLASFLTTLAVGLTGDFYGHHFVFAVPFYVGCALVCLREWDQRIAPTVRMIIPGILTILLLAFFLTLEGNYSDAIAQWKQWAQPRQEAAAVLDDVMDRCQVGRYFDFIDRPEGFYGFTRHSPYGPIFTQYSRFIGVLEVYLEGFGRALQEAEIMVMRTDEEGVPVDPQTAASLKKVFTEKAWECAGSGFVQPKEYRILFREGAR